MKQLLILLLSLILFSSCRKEQKQECPMYKLQPSAYLLGNQQQACSLLASLQLYAGLTAPVEVADMKAALDAGQVQPFDSLAFNNHLAELFALPLDTTALTNAERSILNTIRLHLNPSPVFNCCGGVDYPSTAQIQNVNPANNPDVDINLYLRTGTTDEFEVEMIFKSTISCDVHDIELTGLVGAANPSPATIVLGNLGCVNGKRTFGYYYLTVANPTNPFTFSGTANFRDSTGATLSSSPVEYSF